MGNTCVRIGDRMRYLGIDLDSRWRFQRHFDRLVPRIQSVTILLSCIMPNLEGPEERVRRVSMGVVQATALYGSPCESSCGCRAL